MREVLLYFFNLAKELLLLTEAYSEYVKLLLTGGKWFAYFGIANLDTEGKYRSDLSKKKLEDEKLKVLLDLKYL